MLELIIERGMQILQTSEGEKLPRVVETDGAPTGCRAGAMPVHDVCGWSGPLQIRRPEKRITTPGGLALRGVEVLKYKPAESELKPAMVLCKCVVAFHYPTTHKAHFRRWLKIKGRT